MVQTVVRMSSDELVDLPAEWLSQSGPVEIDLGCHKGTFLVAMAQAEPGVRFLGIERQSSRVEKCLSKISRLGLSNAWAIRREGLGGLRLPGLRTIHVSFPDPWPKRRHWDRRLVNAAFLKEVWEALEPGGTLRLMTDDGPYFLAMQDALARFDGFQETAWDDGREYPKTEFQKRFEAESKPIYRVALARCDSRSSE